MGLDIYLTKVLSKSEVNKLKKKHNVSDLEEISFIHLDQLTNCDTNIETLNLFKDCLVENEIGYYNIPAMLLAGKIKTKDPNLSNYFMSGISSSLKGENYTRFDISHNKDENDVIQLDMLDSEINNYNFKIKELGLFIQDVRYVQRKGITINESLTGKCYRDEIFELFISNESQLQKLNENNRYFDCDLKRDFQIPEHHLLYVNW